jgi:methionyl-tRNA formyltransferase
MDAGAILAQSEVPIGEMETAGELYDRLAADGAPLVLRTLDALAGRNAVETIQDESAVTMAPKLTRKDAILDFSLPAAELARQIRGLYPWPGCSVVVQDQAGDVRAHLTLVRARAAQISGGGDAPGSTHDRGVIVGNGALLEIIEVKPEGKNVMTLTAYRNGHDWAGMRLSSKPAQH